MTSVLLTVIAIFSVQAQQTSNGLTALLNSYYEISKALVNTDAEATAIKAGLFIQANNSFDMKTLPADKADAFIAIRKKLMATAERIRTSKDITKQREYFGSLSLDLYALTKQVKPSGEPVYQVYCPMKKMYWLSNESSIKNPYYGAAMLSCGKVTEIIHS